MASTRLSGARSFLRSQPLLLRSSQRRWAQVHDVRFLATHSDPDSAAKKYKDKLDRKAKEEGYDSVDSLKDAYKEKIIELRRKASTAATPEPSPSSESSPTPSTSPSSVFSTPPPPPPAQTTDAVRDAVKSKSQVPGIKPLSSYLDLEKIKVLPRKEIEALWRLRHASNPNSICAVVPVDAYRRIAQAARDHPQFILPLPRRQADADAESEGEANLEASGTAADMHFLQWAFHPPTSAPPSTSSATSGNTHTSTVLFTHLASYKLHGSYAQPHTTLTHHLDLVDSSGLVLMNGTVIPDRGVSIDEAQWLAMCLQRFYDFGGEGSGRKGELLRMFSRGDAEGFSVQELIAETETIS